ncbi:MAG: phage holin family protein [Bacteroidota bacterium]
MTLILLAAQAGLGSFMVNVLLMSLVLMGAAYLLSGVEIEDFTRAIIVAIVLAVLNATLGRFLNFVTTPIRWITLGLFSLVVDAVVLMIAAHFLKGFTIKNFSWALLMAIFVAIANVFLHFG